MFGTDKQKKEYIKPFEFASENPTVESSINCELIARKVLNLNDKQGKILFYRSFDPVSTIDEILKKNEKRKNKAAKERTT